MTKPPPTPPSSDIHGANRDARAGQAPTEGHSDPGGAISGAKDESAARPDESAPEE